MGGTCSKHGDKCVETLQRVNRKQNSLGRPKNRWEYNIKIDVEEVEFNGVECISLARDRLQSSSLLKAVMNLRMG